VISNAGFELLSEALHLGKRLLVKPLAGQMEQASNAHAISLLKLGRVMKKLDPNAIEHFLAAPSVAPKEYPDVARIIAERIESGNWTDVRSLACSAWDQIVGR
jgi:UDP:flavonoid glycosyltransferase YjiC (YdhE family)